MGFAKFVDWLDKPRNQNEVLHDGVDFSNYIYLVGKLSAGRQVVEDLVVTWRKIIKV